jgi:hypothetical protein
MGALIEWTVRVLIICYLAALALVVADIQGWFGSGTGPLARAFLEKLGWPWNRMISDAPIQMLPWLQIGAPIGNIVLLNILGGQFRR